MARIPSLPSLDIIRGLKGILDFYLWKGLPCVRAWPTYRPARQTPASLAAALLFGAIIRAFALTHGAVLEQLALEATGIPRTPRDIYVSGVFGNLHEASMSDFLTLLTQCRDFLSNLTDLLHALDSIDTDEIVVNVDQSVLPPLAATTTNQATVITALQKIDDLQDALASKALDRLLVRGSDQLFSYQDRLLYRLSANLAGGNTYIETPQIGAGLVWAITNIVMYNNTTPTTRHQAAVRRGGVSYWFHEEARAFAIGDRSSGPKPIFVKYQDTIRAQFLGGINGDSCYLHLTGYIMTKET